MSWDWQLSAEGHSQPGASIGSERRIGDITHLINGLPYDAQYFGDQGEPLIRIRTLQDPTEDTRYAGPSLTGYRVTPESLLVGMDGDFNIGRWDRNEPALLNQRVLSLEGASTIIRWIEYCLPSILSITNDLTYATTVKHLASRQVARARVPWPGNLEVHQIVDYLDHETAEIDAFVADLERLLDLSRERQVAAISRAVHHGDSRDPDSPFTPVPWAPGASTPFPVVNIRRAADMRTGHTPSRQHNEYWEGAKEIPWFTLADVWQLRQGQKFLGGTAENISDIGLRNSAAELLPAGTVILSRTASVGFSGIMPRPMATSQDFWNWVCHRDLDPEYLWYQFRAMRPEFDRIKSGSTHKTIYQADAAALKIVLPPLAEQKAMVATLRESDDIATRQAADATAAIALAKERRAALITAAVTGQIDVTQKHRPVAEQLEENVTG